MKHFTIPKTPSLPNIIRSFSWAVNEAGQNYGVHIGGPYENEFRRRLERAERDLSEFENLLKAKRLRVCAPR